MHSGHTRPGKEGDGEVIKGKAAEVFSRTACL